jgi:hypothetical protein
MKPGETKIWNGRKVAVMRVVGTNVVIKVVDAVGKGNVYVVNYQELMPTRIPQGDPDGCPGCGLGVPNYRSGVECPGCHYECLSFREFVTRSSRV